MCKEGESCPHWLYRNLTHSDFLEPTPKTLDTLWTVFPQPNMSVQDRQFMTRVNSTKTHLEDPHFAEVPHTLNNVRWTYTRYDFIKQNELFALFMAYSQSHKYFTVPLRPESFGKGGLEYGIKKAVGRATILKEAGNVAFKSYRYHLALNLYMESFKALCPFSTDLSLFTFVQLQEIGLSQLEHALTCNLLRAMIKIASSDIDITSLVCGSILTFTTAMIENPASTKSQSLKLIQLYTAAMEVYPGLVPKYPTREQVKWLSSLESGDDEWIHQTCCGRLDEIQQEDLD